MGLGLATAGGCDRLLRRRTLYGWKPEVVGVSSGWEDNLRGVSSDAGIRSAQREKKKRHG